MEFTLHFLKLFLLDIIHASPVLAFLAILIILIGWRIGSIEGWARSDAIYHAFINATTVGYGDFRPSKKRSKKLAIALAFVGMVFTSMVVAIALHAANHAYAHVYEAGDFWDRSP
jgi:voltage-gated potassium channel